MNCHRYRNGPLQGVSDRSRCSVTAFPGTGLLLTGFLPCGLVYSFLALAASSGSVGKGLLIMLSFGLGTIPVMLVTGAGLSLATIGIRRKLIRVAAVSVVVTGRMTAGRGIVFAANGEELPDDGIRTVYGVGLLITLLLTAATVIGFAMLIIQMAPR